MEKLALFTIAWLAFAILASGCASTTAVTVNLRQVCPSWREIRVSKDDTLTPETARQILGNDEARRAAGCKSRVMRPTPKEVS